MTEHEWLVTTDPTRKLHFLQGKITDRRWRLYLCGGCRRFTHLFFRPASLSAVNVGERFADGHATEQERDRADWAAESPTFGYELDGASIRPDAPFRVEVVPRLIEMGILPEGVRSDGDWRIEEPIQLQLRIAASLAWQCACIEAYHKQWLKYIDEIGWPGHWLMDCVFGNPFCPVAIDPAWLTWRDATVPKLAQAAYDERSLPLGELDRVHLAVLADALEEAGCTNADMVAHLRSPGPHVRGCWVVDLLLGKE